MSGSRASQLKYCFNFDFVELEYHKMPRLFHLEDYDECLVYPTGAYCIVDISITTDKPSEVYDLVKVWTR